MALKLFIFLLSLVIGCLSEQEKVLASADNHKTSEPPQIPQTIINLNACFRYVPDVKLKISAEHLGGTETIQFKDECLKACLRSQIQKVFTCRSLLHIPTDDDCLLTTTDMHQTEYTRINEFPPINYYENICAINPYGTESISTEARFNSFKGGQGIIKFSQKYDNPTKALLIMDGIKENTKIQVRHYPENTEDCFKLKKEEIARSKPLLESITDSAGMAVVPWSEVDVESNHENLLETLILIVEDDHTIIECGRVRLSSNSHESLKSNGNHFLAGNVYLITLIALLLSKLNQ